jgi:hypothetical protein
VRDDPTVRPNREAGLTAPSEFPAQTIPEIEGNHYLFAGRAAQIHKRKMWLSATGNDRGQGAERNPPRKPVEAVN